MKVWITKYALSAGVFSVEGEVSERSGGMFVYRSKPSGFLQFAHGGDWHTTESAALDRAEEMRQKKIASLRKQIKKLEGMQIKVTS